MEEVLKKLRELYDEYHNKAITASDGRTATMYASYAAGIKRAIAEIKSGA